ncbi:hypothetical protein FRC06_004836 [Ceratobasidium sp. 370]|nr:hypothetical protein FRC06_004836 [Ceratobasidium sp. 370]
MWAAGLGGATLYIIAYFILWKTRRGNVHLTRDEDERNPFDVQSRSTTSSRDSDSPAKLLCYPLVYAACIVPLSITRFIAFYGGSQGPGVPPLLMFFIVVFYLMGMLNVMLTIWTRPEILLIGSDGELSSDDPRYVTETS